MIGLTGPHRSGKTTLAQEWREHMAENEIAIDFLTISTTDVIARFGLECGDINDVATRIDVQRAIADRCHEVFNGRRTPFISDRTPLDVAAYLLADLQQAPLPDALEQRAMDIVEDCIDITNACFGGILLVPAAIPYVAEAGKPPLNKGYQFHHETLVRGLINEPRLQVNTWSLNRSVVARDARVEILTEVYGALIENDTYVAEVVDLH